MLGLSKMGMMGGAPYIAPGVTFTGYAHGMASTPMCIGYGLDKWWVGCLGGQLYSSPSGKAGSWTLVTTFSSFVPGKIEYAAGRLIIIATDQVKWSIDGSTFNSYAYTAIGSSQGISACYAGGYFLVAFGDASAGKYLWTADFTTWTVTTNTNPSHIAGFVWDGSNFLAASVTNQALRAFTDPAPTTAWPTQGVAPGINRFNTVVMTGARILGLGYIVGTSQAQQAYTDDGGATWTTGTTPGPSGTDSWVDGYSAGGLVFAIMNPTGSNGWLYKSTDGGATISLLFSVTAEVFRDVAYGDGRFTVVSSTKIYIDR